MGSIVNLIYRCTGLFIVAPINRAVDDKAAKSLLGESFKRQLKFDGTYSRITFICSKTDDISITEASDSLGLEDKMGPDWEKIDEIEKQVRELKQSTKDLKDSRAVYLEVMNDCEEQIEVWEELKDKVEAGKKVRAPQTSKKRKRVSFACLLYEAFNFQGKDTSWNIADQSQSPETTKTRKKARSSKYLDDDDDDDFIDDDEEEEEDAKENGSDCESDSEEKSGPLTLEEVEDKIAKLKEDKKRAVSRPKSSGEVC